MTLTLPRFEERLVVELGDGVFTRGVQAAVTVGTERVDVVLGEDGLGRPMTGRSMFRVYSTGKPVTAVAFARLVDRGLVGFDTPVRDVLDGTGFDDLEPPVTFVHVLHHTAGLHELHGAFYAMLSDEHRRALARAQVPPDRWRVGVDAGYSDWVGWHLLAFAIEALSGTPFPAVLRREVCEPLGLDDLAVGMDRAEYDRLRDRIGINVDLSELDPVPMLGEGSFAACSSVNPAFGLYTTAADLAAVYRAVLAAMVGSPGAILSCEIARQLVGRRRGRRFDHAFEAELDYALGFMVGLQDWRFGPAPSEAAFGHSGFLGTTLAFADPAYDLACAVVFNGIVDEASALDLRRPAVVSSLYGDLR